MRIYVANGNNDSISVLDPKTSQERGRIELSLLRGQDARCAGVQPVGTRAQSRWRLSVCGGGGHQRRGRDQAATGQHGDVVGHIPAGWWPSSVRVSADGRSLYVANASGRGAGPNLVGESRSPKFSVLGTVNIIPTPRRAAARSLHRARICATTALRQRDPARRRRYGGSGLGVKGFGQPDSEPGREGERADQARRLHQQGKRHARSDTR